MATRVGLGALAVALPRWRLTRAEWARAWGRPGGDGSRPVAGHDEDSLTLCCDAASEVIVDGVQGLICASTTAPHAERSTAALIARALRLADGEVVGPFTADLGTSLRASTAAAALAAAAVQSHGGDVVVAAADCRDVDPGSDLEPVLGDAGAALRLGSASDSSLAVLIGSASFTDDLPDTWRAAHDDVIQRADPAFAPRRTMPAAVCRASAAALADAQVDSSSVAAVASGAADLRVLRDVFSSAGIPAPAFEPAAAAAAAAGFTGVAAPWIALGAALDAARPGDVVLQVAYGSGSADALVWRAGDAVLPWQQGGGSRIADAVASAQAIPSYTRWLRLRGRLPSERPEPYSSLPLLAREADQDIALSGSECPTCGRFAYPMRRLCEGCGNRSLRPRALGRRGGVLTYTEDHIVPSPEPPTVMAVADMEGGGRFYGQLNAAPGQVWPGLPVRLVLRRLHEGGGFTHYFWKMRPDMEVLAEQAAAAGGVAVRA